MNDGCPRSRDVTALVDGRLDRAATLAIRDHLIDCEDCELQHEAEVLIANRTTDIRRFEERTRRLWSFAAAVLGGGVVGNAVGGPIGGLAGMAIGYSAYRAALASRP